MLIEITCYNCDEKGWQLFLDNGCPNQETCEVCNGRKTVKVPEEMAVNVDVCPSCKGTGFTGFARTFDETCSCCLGTGVYPPENPCTCVNPGTGENCRCLVSE